MQVKTSLLGSIGLLSAAALTFMQSGTASATGIDLRSAASIGVVRGPRADVPANFHPNGAKVSGFRVLHSFTNADGSSPAGALVEDVAGNLYGETLSGGSGGDGVIFKSTNSGTVTDLYSFSGADGISPTGGLRDIAGDYVLSGKEFGLTQAGSASGGGNVFTVTTSGAFAVLHPFGFADGEVPVSRLVLFPDGYYYGTTSAGGVGNGTVFKISPSGRYTVLHTFSGAADGGSPQGGLGPSAAGFLLAPVLYGTTTVGGTYGAGTIYSISPSGTLKTLYNFNPATDGNTPLGELQTDFLGNLYGVTNAGGTGNAGTIFKISASGSGFSTLYSFPLGSGNYPLGANPAAGLSFALNGAFYGTTSFGASAGAGNVFKFSHGSVTSLHDFNGTTDGSNPEGRLLTSIDGNIYGTTTNAGVNGNGTLFALPLH